jgi:hypothetical protein
MPNVEHLSKAPEARWQGHRFFLTDGVSWTLLANHVPIKARYQVGCIFDASSSRLTPLKGTMDLEVFLALLNSDVFSFCLKRFVKHNEAVEVNDLRAMPIIMPTVEQAEWLKKLGTLALETKKLSFDTAPPSHDIVASVRILSEGLKNKAPTYLQPSAQMMLLQSADDCLKIIQLAIDYAAEQLYGVEGCGPFNAF